MVNVGYAVVPDAKNAGANIAHQNVRSASCAQDLSISKHTALLFEVYYTDRDTAGEQSLLAWNAGIKHQLTSNLRVFTAAGTGLHERSGATELRIFAGLKYQFDAPWKRAGAR